MNPEINAAGSARASMTVRLGAVIRGPIGGTRTSTFLYLELSQRPKGVSRIDAANPSRKPVPYRSVCRRLLKFSKLQGSSGATFPYRVPAKKPGERTLYGTGFLSF